jgi:hypothetical protein
VHRPAGDHPEIRVAAVAKDVVRIGVSGSVGERLSDRRDASLFQVRAIV